VKIRSMGDTIGTYGWNFAYQAARADGASVLAAVLVANDEMARFLARDIEWRQQSAIQQREWWEGFDLGPEGRGATCRRQDHQEVRQPTPGQAR
jgi:hypothetical protein